MALHHHSAQDYNQAASDAATHAQAENDIMIAICEVLEKHGTAAVLGAIAQFAGTLADHVRDDMLDDEEDDTKRNHAADCLSSAVHALKCASGDIARVENAFGITLANAGEVLIR